VTTVCIIGAGDVGGAAAHALARGGRVRQVRLIDPAQGVAIGKALDIQQSGAIDGLDTRLEGTNDVTRTAGCAVCIVADRAAPPAIEWQADEGLALVRRVAGFLGDAPIVFAGVSQSDLLLTAAREARIPRRRLVGSAPEALAAAIAAIVAMEARCSPAEVSLTVLGTPPAGFVVPWSDASIGGLALERALTQTELRRVEARASRLWPPGPFTLGSAAARVAEAIVRSSRRARSVLTVLDGEFGVRGCAGALPALLCPAGIAHTRTPSLNTRERVQLDVALGG
jgi:malate dehydrogenase